MKKGFTLIELAIALMVIGLILAMAMKGRAVIDSAAIRSDVNKVNKLTAAVTSYVSKYDKLPGYSHTDGAGDKHYQLGDFYEDLADEGLLTLTDFTLELEGAETYLAVVGCENKPDGTRTIEYANFEKTRNICVMPSSIAPSDIRTFNASHAKNVTKFACYLESTADDKNMAEGTGRGTPTSGLAADYDFSNCGKAKAVSAYTYVIF